MAFNQFFHIRFLEMDVLENFNLKQKGTYFGKGVMLTNRMPAPATRQETISSWRVSIFSLPQYLFISLPHPLDQVERPR
jgi:hypothetical protein